MSPDQATVHSDRAHLSSAMPTLPAPAPWTSALATLGGLSLSFALVAFFDEQSSIRETLLRSPLSQACTLGLFWWGAAQIWLHRRRMSAERRALARLKAELSPSLSSALIKECLSAEVLSDEALRRKLSPFEPFIAGAIGWSALRSLYSAARAGAVSYEPLVQSLDRSYQQCFERVEAEYRGVTAVMWLMPLSGFLGTVIGMSGAIASFDTVIASAGVDLKSLAPAVAGLATAFDTTLVALALVVPLKLAEVSSERRDQALLDEADQALGVGLIDRLNLAELDELARAAQRSTSMEESERFAATKKRLGEVQRAAVEAGQALSELSERLERLSKGLGAPLSELSQALDLALREDRLEQEGLERALMSASRELSGRLIETLEAHEEARRVSAARSERALEALIEQSERPLILSRGERS